MERKAVIVTGGAGFIGSHACKALAGAGYLPVVVDNLRTGHADSVKWGPFENIDLRDTDAIATVIGRYGAKTVMHFAACAYVGESVQTPDLYYDNNVGGTLSLLRAMHRTGCRQMVFSSSCATYGIPNELPVRETTPQRPVNPYGRTKLICEEMIRDHAAAYGCDFAMLRYFNACGADPAGELAERHDPETHLIPLALMAASGAGPALRVFGTDYDTPDGTCIRDYVHVSDLAEAHVLAMAHLARGGDSIALNLGTGRGLSILEIAAAIESVLDKRLPWTAAERRPGDPPCLIADASEAARILGFRPRMSDIGTILAHAATQFGLEVRDAVCA